MKKDGKKKEDRERERKKKKEREKERERETERKKERERERDRNPVAGQMRCQLFVHVRLASVFAGGRAVSNLPDFFRPPYLRSARPINYGGSPPDFLILDLLVVCKTELQSCTFRVHPKN